jgi:hypothetical protein
VKPPNLSQDVEEIPSPKLKFIDAIRLVLKKPKPTICRKTRQIFCAKPKREVTQQNPRPKHYLAVYSIWEVKQGTPVEVNPAEAPVAVSKTVTWSDIVRRGSLSSIGSKRSLVAPQQSDPILLRKESS